MTLDCKTLTVEKPSLLKLMFYRKKMIALVAQKFISDVAMDAMQFSRMRQVSTTAGASEAARKAASIKVNSNT